MTSYRYPGEQVILFLTLILVALLFLLTAGLTICILPLLLIFVVFYAYQVNLSHHQVLLKKAIPIQPDKSPGLVKLIQDCARKIKPGEMQVYVLPSQVMNAYTFGFSDPKGLVLFSRLLKEMDEKELAFVIGHEMGHAALGHVWINTLLGGLGGVPQSVGGLVILTLAFRWWNRACEYSSDRAGLLACGSLEKATTALVKLAVTEINTPEELERAKRLIHAQDDSPINVLAEAFSTHPMIVRRLENLKEFARTNQYQLLQEQVNQAVRLV